jgi:glycosyltransferase involved in cell wall biosynthesis
MSHPLTILMLVTRRQKRGAEVSAANLSRQLTLKGHQVIWVGLYPAGDDELILDGMVNIDLKGGTSFFSMAKWLDLRSIIKKYKVDIIQANGSDNLKYAIASTWGIASCKVIYRNISLVSYWIGNSFLKKLFYGGLSRKADHVVSVGEPSRKDFIKTYSYPENKISVIHRGIPVNPLDKKECRKFLQNEFSIPNEATILVWAGALSVEKDPILALEILERISQQKDSIYLVYAGKGILENAIRRQAAEKSLSNVILAGYRQDLSVFLAGADVLLLTSQIEGVPGVVLEAAVEQTIAVATHVGGVGEAIMHGETGILVSNRDPQYFAQQVIDLLNDPVKQQKMSIAAFDNVKHKFDEKVTTDAFIKLYCQLTTNN